MKIYLSLMIIMLFLNQSKIYSNIEPNWINCDNSMNKMDKKISEFKNIKYKQELLTNIKILIKESSKSIIFNAISDNGYKENELNKEILGYLKDIINEMKTGVSFVFASASIGKVELTFQNETAIWKNKDISNFFDKAKPWTDVLGTGLTLISIFTSNSSNKNNDKKNSNISISIGAGILVIGNLLKTFAGTSENDIYNQAGSSVVTAGSNNIEGEKSDLKNIIDMKELITVSKLAYENSKIRRSVFDEYYRNSKETLEKLGKEQLIIEELLKIDNINIVRIIEVIDSVLLIYNQWDGMKDFFENYLNEIKNIYKTYQSSYPSTFKVDSVDNAIKELEKLQDDYQKYIKEPFLKRIPLLKDKIYKWKLELT